MKTKVLTGIALMVLPIMAMVFLQWPILDALLAFFSAVAAHELCHAAKIKNKLMIVAAVVMAPLSVAVMSLPFWRSYLDMLIFPVLMVFFLVMVAFMLKRFTQTPFGHLLYAMVAAVVVPGAFASLALLRSHFIAYDQILAVYFLFLTFCSCWLTDAFAYFTGKAFGKRKMCPNVSPNKTWEGAIGGVLLTSLFNVGFAMIFNAFFLQNYRVSLLAVVLISLPLCVTSILGDLAASSLKRNQEIKDFGRLFPGHGGAMDRFDSMLFVAPMMLAFVQLTQAFGFLVLFQ